MAWWICTLNVAVMLLAPILIYVLISVEDLLDWIDQGSLVPGNGGLRALILFFCPGLGAVLYSFYFS